MTRLVLRIDRDPGGAGIFVKLAKKDGDSEWISALIDTGAEVSVLPGEFLSLVEHKLTQRGRIVVQQAGVARQSFEVVEAIISLSLEDQFGALTPELQAKVGFTETDQPLVGFAGLLDRATLHLDMLNLPGYLEFPASWSRVIRRRS